MQEWIANNWLAFYGAVVGTLALGINFSKFIHAINKDKIKIRVSVSDHPQKLANIKLLKDGEDNEPLDRINMAEVYIVTVRNIGNVNAHIDDAGVICTHEKSHSALVSSPTGGGCILVSISEAKLDPIAPKSSKKFSIYLQRGQECFEARRAFVVDSTGEKWLAKA